MKNRRLRNQRTVFVFFLLGLFCLTTLMTGCEPLRKKFTRKKKVGKENLEYEPILDPIEYPEKVYDPKADYRYYYSLFRVWEKELIAGLDDQASLKRLNYFLNNMIVQLEGMEKLIIENKVKGLKVLVKSFNEIQDDFKRPLQRYSLQDIKRKVKSLAKKVSSAYSFSSIEDDIRE